MAKWKFGPYLPGERSSWLKVRNRQYSQWAGREQLFERERGGNPDVPQWWWDGCVRACAASRVFNNGGFVALAATLSSMNKIPVAALVLLLGIDRFLNEARAVANLIGNGIATVAVANLRALETRR